MIITVVCHIIGVDIENNHLQEREIIFKSWEKGKKEKCTPL